MNLYSIGQFAKLIGKTTQTLRDWDKKGVLTPEYITSEKQLQEVLQFSNVKKRFSDKVFYF
jgi:DNA-binding transcriptional MerR regulator